MMYQTRAATKDEQKRMGSIPSPLGHIVTGYDSEWRPAIETMSEVQAAKVTHVQAIRRRMPNGKYQYRVIVER